jgi:hypothetical protein
MQLALVLMIVAAGAAQPDSGWRTLFDGQTLSGWKASEASDSFEVVDGAIVARGKPRSHLFFLVDDEPYKNFELTLEVKAGPGSNSGVYFHTRYQERGWPKYGFEAQINTSHRDRVKTGSLYHVVDVEQSSVPDDEWFAYTIRVEGKRVVIRVNGETTVDYTEPEGKRAGRRFTALLDRGTFALQAHDPRSIVSFKNIRVRRLPD